MPELWDGLAPSLQRHLNEVERGGLPETPKPGDPVFAGVETRLIASNRLALEAAGRRALELGLVPEIVETPLVGEAAAAGAQIAQQLRAGNHEARPTRCLIAGRRNDRHVHRSGTGIGRPIAGTGACGRTRSCGAFRHRSPCSRPEPTAATARPTPRVPSWTGRHGIVSRRRAGIRSGTCSVTTRTPLSRRPTR